MEDEGRTVGSDEARSQFRSLLNAVEHDGEHVTVVRYQTPAAVMVPVRWYEEARALMRNDTKGMT